MNPRAALSGALFAILVQSAPAGLDEGIAAYRRGDYQAALRELQPLAENGVAEAQLFLGVMYAPPAIPTEVPMRVIGLAVVLTLSLVLTPLAAEAQPAAKVYGVRER